MLVAILSAAPQGLRAQICNPVDQALFQTLEKLETGVVSGDAALRGGGLCIDLNRYRFPARFLVGVKFERERNKKC